MGRKPISIEKRAEIAALLKVYSNYSDVAKQAKVSRTLVRNTAIKIKNGEALSNRIGQGRRRSTTNSDDQSLKTMAKRDRTQSLRTLAQRWGQSLGKTIGKTTVSRRLQEMGLKSYVQKKKPFRNRRQIKQRRNWCARMQGWNKDLWARVIWSDESHFQLVNRSTRTFVRRSPREENCSFSFKARLQGGGGDVSVWGCFTANGPGPILFYKGRLNSAAYVTLISAVLPQLLNDLSADQDGDWYFQQDNAPCHKAANTIRWFDEQGIQLLPWPPTSPDLNPIENVWSIIDRQLEKMKINGIAELEEAIKKIWYSIDKKTWKKLSDSLCERVPKILKQKGRSCSQY
jgi:transposase